MSKQWTTKTLFDALHDHADQAGHPFALTLHNNGDHAISAELREYGDLPVIIVVAEQEIRVSAVLCEQSSVKEPATFNETCLRLGPALPLSNIGLVDGHYIVFGQLSIHSSLDNIVEELNVLGHNTIQTAHDLQSLHH